MDILKRNRHPHPLIYMRGVNSEELGAIVYFGEANIFQQNLDSFLALAEELRLSGLTESGVLVDTKETPNKARRKKEEEKTKMIKIPLTATQWLLYKTTSCGILMSKSSP